jgi:hypothetical protein
MALDAYHRAPYYFHFPVELCIRHDNVDRLYLTALHQIEGPAPATHKVFDACDTIQSYIPQLVSYLRETADLLEERSNNGFDKFAHRPTKRSASWKRIRNDSLWSGGHHSTAPDGCPPASG